MAKRPTNNNTKNVQLSRGRFHMPKQNVFNNPREVGVGSVSSDYILNNYNVEYTIQEWRKAIDEATNWSNLIYLDRLYTWCVQSSPFLLSLIEKRITPAVKNKYYVIYNGRRNKRLTNQMTNTLWFREIIKAIIKKKFYGIRAIGIDVKKDTVVNFPIRNIDWINKGLRSGTYEFTQIVNFDQYDNLFCFDSGDAQEDQFGMMQSISRNMILINNIYINWFVSGERFAYPYTQIGYPANDAKAKADADIIAKNLNPRTITRIPYDKNKLSNDGKPLYRLDITHSTGQAYPNAFETFKQEVAELKSDIMQLVLGGTLLGATEKNTNSEKLASIHKNLYHDKTDEDDVDILYDLNSTCARKLERLFGFPEGSLSFGIDQEEFINMDDAKTIVESATKQERKLSLEFWRKVGLQDADFEKESMWTKIFGQRQNNNNNEPDE